jgi:hypothetical protein
MKFRTFHVIVLITLLGAANSVWAKPTEREQVLLRRLFKEYIQGHLQGVAVGNSIEEIRQNAESAKNPDVRRSAVLALISYPDQESELTLLRVLEKNDDPYSRFNAACVLARHGKDQGLSLLQQTAMGKGATSQPGFEQSEAGLAILMLGRDLPKGFSFRAQANPIFSDLEVFVVSKNEGATE